MAASNGGPGRGPLSLPNNTVEPHISTSHRMTRTEVLQGVANRFVFSRLYILLYLGMAGLSLATVVLSLLSDCPTVAWYILEIIINVVLVAEVCLRLVAFGKSFFKSHWNSLDLFISVLCVITILVVFSNGCAGKGEEIFDLVILVVRNLLQFGRLALIFRRSGKSIFSRIPAVHLDGARSTSFSLDLDMDDEEAADAMAHRRRSTTVQSEDAKPRRSESQPFSLSEADSDEET